MGSLPIATEPSVGWMSGAANFLPRAGGIARERPRAGRMSEVATIDAHRGPLLCEPSGGQS